MLQWASVGLLLSNIKNRVGHIRKSLAQLLFPLIFEERDTAQRERDTFEDVIDKQTDYIQELEEFRDKQEDWKLNVEADAVKSIHNSMSKTDVQWMEAGLKLLLTKEYLLTDEKMDMVSHIVDRFGAKAVTMAGSNFLDDMGPLDQSVAYDLMDMKQHRGGVVDLTKQLLNDIPNNLQIGIHKMPSFGRSSYNVQVMIPSRVYNFVVGS